MKRKKENVYALAMGDDFSCGDPHKLFIFLGLHVEPNDVCSCAIIHHHLFVVYIVTLDPVRIKDEEELTTRNEIDACVGVVEPGLGGMEGYSGRWFWVGAIPVGVPSDGLDGERSVVCLGFSIHGRETRCFVRR